MSLTLLFLYTPVSVYFFYVNLDITWLSYDWGVIHDPEVWWIIPYVPALGVRTFDRWVSIIMSFFVFAYFGLGGEALDMYRKWMLGIGLGKLFPGLKEQRQERMPDEPTSWTSQFSLISRAKDYLDSSRKNSTATTLETIIDRCVQTFPKLLSICFELLTDPTQYIKHSEALRRSH
jgi:pheromone a factor receptor